jgi:hypothetical protein
VPTYFEKKSKPFTKSSGMKQYYKSSCTIFEGPSKERHGEQTNIEINAS